MKISAAPKPIFILIILISILIPISACTATLSRSDFTNYPIVIGEGTAFPLTGMLSMPCSDDPVPAVVIVHGSGPIDMDGNVAGSKPYRDIADYLAAEGIAVVRYHKRTLAHGAAMIQEFGGSLTVWEESIEDAIWAADILRADPRVDADRVFIIGHSLGGMLAPRIHSEGGNFAGLILLAGTPRSFPQVVLDQGRMQLVQLPAGADRALGENQLADLEALFAAIPSMDIAEAKNTFIIGVSAYYLQDLEIRSFSYYIGEVDVPILALQGGRDFQVLEDVDFAMLRDLLTERNHVKFKVYPDLNHLFMHTAATNFAEHAEGIMSAPGQVDSQVLADIAAWIHAH